VYNAEPRISAELLSSGFIQWQPSCDLYILNNEVVLTFDLAGIAIKDITVYMNKWHMSIVGTRRQPPRFTPDCCTFHNSEIPYGKFYRHIDFPLPIEQEKMLYEMSHGLFTLVIPAMKEKVIPIEEA